MKEYIKKFASASAANDYAIAAIPFATTILGPNSPTDDQNLVCNESGKKLVNVAGIIEVQTAGPEMVDLGLSSGILWAATNVGAVPGSTKESYYGNYYAWGETETKSDYSWNTYKFGASSPFSKYDTDGKTVLEAVDDVATATYGSDYVMPTITEIQEMVNETDREWVTNYNGISDLNGYKFMKKSDHSVFIFIPAAGYFNGSSVDAAGSYGDVWSSSLSLNNHSNTMRFDFVSDNIYISGDCARCFGLNVRAIQRV